MEHNCGSHLAACEIVSPRSIFFGTIHRHYSNPFKPGQILTYPDHGGDMPRGIIADIIEDLGLTKEEFYSD